MELRMAFGPGTRLWAHRSREDLCYDWLHYKAREAYANFRHFALALYAREVYDSPRRKDLSALRRRVVAVLRHHRIKRPTTSRPGRPRPAVVPTPSTAKLPGTGSLSRTFPAGGQIPLPSPSCPPQTPIP
jgi:hypothetical protein